MRIGISKPLLFSYWWRRRVSSRDGLFPAVKAVFGLGMAGAEGIGGFSLKMSEGGQWGWCGVIEYRELRV